MHGDQAEFFHPSNINDDTPPRPLNPADAYWYFAAERQNIFFRRLSGRKEPWTDDPILAAYKFTNTYRASDRVSQFLIRDVIYRGSQDPTDIFFRIILFKLFNKIETWRMLLSAVGEVSWRAYDRRLYDAVLTRALTSDRRIYSAAYIMPSPAFGHVYKHQNHLALLDQMMLDDMPARVTDAKSLESVFRLLRAYRGIGSFLAYQFAIDLNYSNLIDFDEDSFVVAGPGAIEGIQKCFPGVARSSEDVIREMVEAQESHFSRLGIKFRDLWGRPLKLIDGQNVFCEVGKYARVAFPPSPVASGRRRIKQKFRQTQSPVAYAYPEKWNLPASVTARVAG